MTSNIINRTQADNFGETFGLYREKNESIVDFQSRIYQAKEGIKRKKESFNNSLDYITSVRSKSLFRVERDSSSPEIISFDGYFFYIDGQEYKVDDYKFVNYDYNNYDLINNYHNWR